MRVLGIDYGRRRIGLALSDATGLLARPWKSVARLGSAAEVAALLAREVAALPEDEGLTAIVIGYPRHLDGRPHDLAPTIDAVASRLEVLTGLTVHRQDERLTSREAEERLASRVRDWRARKALLDAAAAAVILQDFLDAPARTRPAPAPSVEDR
jgi:putative Holliday junction resolvase